MIGKLKKHALVDWQAFDTVLLDMDGTLLDRHFDDYFWEQYLPEQYAAKNGLVLAESRQQLLGLYKKREGTLEWTDLDFWSEKLGLDIPELKIQIDHLIAVHPFVIDFLRYIKKNGKDLHLVTNAHSKTLDIKMRKTAIGGYFDRIICSAEVGLAKEAPEFWQRLEDLLKFNPARTLLADDTEKVLNAAADYGLAGLVFVAKPSSQRPIVLSAQYPSIVYFKELMYPV
ncbi:MAG: haloacid dehalogenase [Deltaproteobacteria bacterium RIFOXYD12_FULL_50_9]|nr:MAG: haloacid dehalogenase [Deltaproteobacteria bacterium RIFOXYD12_FULL_50_9]